MNLEYIIKKDDNFKTVKEVLISKFNISHRLLVTLKNNNAILLNNKKTYINKDVFVNDKIIVSFNYNEDNSNIIPKEMKLDIIYEDECYLIVNKPARNICASFYATLWR